MAIERIVTNVVIVGWILAGVMPKTGRDWLAALALDRLHVEGLSIWLGLSGSMPPAVVDKIEELLRAWSTTPVKRELAALGHNDLCPVAVLSADGLELPPVASSAIDDEDLQSMGVLRATRRPMRIVVG